MLRRRSVLSRGLRAGMLGSSAIKPYTENAARRACPAGSSARLAGTDKSGHR